MLVPCRSLVETENMHAALPRKIGRQLVIQTLLEEIWGSNGDPPGLPCIKATRYLDYLLA